MSAIKYSTRFFSFWKYTVTSKELLLPAFVTQNFFAKKADRELEPQIFFG